MKKVFFFYLANQTAVDRPLTSWPCSVGGKPSICGHLMNSIFPSIYKTMGSVYVYKVAGINSSARYFHGAAITEIRAAVPFVSIANSNSGNVNTTRFTHASWVSNPFPAFPVRALPDRDAGDVQKGNKQKKCKTSVLTEPNVFSSLCYCSTSKHMSPFLRKKRKKKSIVLFCEPFSVDGNSVKRIGSGAIIIIPRRVNILSSLSRRRRRPFFFPLIF